MGWVIRLGSLIGRSDLSGFLSAYQATGRKAIHPRILLGLIVYGMLLGQWSLRDLEKLARRDVGAWWLCGGLQPDHSTIGKFICLHVELLTDAYFVSLTRMLVKALRISKTDIAGDGTVIEAWGSRWKNMKAEAVRQEAQRARERAEKSPEDPQAVSQADELERAAQVAAERQAKAESRGKGKKGIEICVTEPDAVVQPKKDKTHRASYKPSLLVNEQRLIVGQALHPSSETAVVQPMLGQHEEIFDSLPSRMLLDAGFSSFDVLGLAVALDLDLLCPSGNVEAKGRWQKGSEKGKFPKSDFTYDEQTDTYLCPAGQRLNGDQREQNAQGRKYRRYRAKHCLGCALRKQCTESKRGRTLKRYEDEALKEAMAEVLRHPKARARYRKRVGMAEPVFSVLIHRQGLRRFHRRGTNQVKLEFALHCLAYNLGLAIRLYKDQEGQLFGSFVLIHHQGNALLLMVFFFQLC
jgi:transposase